MFERFTDRARRVIVLAQEEARQMRHQYIGTEDILVGLIHEGEGVAALVLLDIGVTLDRVRHEVASTVASDAPETRGHINFTPRAKKVCELSLREALGLGHSYIGTEHLLLGLIREGEGIGAKVLANLGVDLSLARQLVIKKLSGYANPPAQRYLRSPDRISYVDALQPGVDALLGYGWTLVEKVIGPVLCPDCQTAHTCARYVEVEAIP